jgi:hypothetical protein
VSGAGWGRLFTPLLPGALVYSEQKPWWLDFATWFPRKDSLFLFLSEITIFYSVGPREHFLWAVFCGGGGGDIVSGLTWTRAVVF